jgi:HEAT repeat protein
MSAEIARAEPHEVSRLSTAELLDRANAFANDHDVDGEARWAVVGVLRTRGERTVFEHAMEWCTNANPAHRALGADILSRLGAPTLPFAAESTPVLVSLLQDSDEHVRVEAIYALGHLRVGSTSEIATFARDRSQRIRNATATALGRREEPVALEALCLLTTDHDRDVRDWATFALGSLCLSDSAEIREALAARLSDEDEEVRDEALVGLARRGDQRAAASIDELTRRGFLE